MGINRIRLQNGAMGDPRVDARMQQTYQQNIADNQAQQARNEGIFQAARDKLQGFVQALNPSGNTILQRMQNAQNAPSASEALGNLYNKQGIAEAENKYIDQVLASTPTYKEKINKVDDLMSGSGFVSDLRHKTAAAQLRDSLGGGIMGNIAANVGGALREIPQLLTGDFKGVGEDLKANYGGKDIPVGLTPQESYDYLIAQQQVDPGVVVDQPSAMPQGSPGQLNPVPPGEQNYFPVYDGELGRYLTEEEYTNRSLKQIAERSKPTMADVAGPSGVDKFKTSNPGMEFGTGAGTLNIDGTLVQVGIDKATGFPSYLPLDEAKAIGITPNANLASGGRVGFQDGTDSNLTARQVAEQNPELNTIREQLFGENYLQDIDQGTGIAQYYTGFGQMPTLDYTPPVVEEAEPAVDVTQPIVDTGGGGGGAGISTGNEIGNTDFEQNLLDQGIGVQAEPGAPISAPGEGMLTQLAIDDLANYPRNTEFDPNALEQDIADVATNTSQAEFDALAEGLPPDVDIDSMYPDQVPEEFETEGMTPMDVREQYGAQGQYEGYVNPADVEAGLATESMFDTPEQTNAINEAFNNVKDLGAAGVDKLRESLTALGGKVKEGFDNTIEIGGKTIDLGKSLIGGALSFATGIPGIGFALNAIQSDPVDAATKTGLQEQGYEFDDIGRLTTGPMAGYSVESAFGDGIADATLDRIDKIENRSAPQTEDSIEKVEELYDFLGDVTGVKAEEFGPQEDIGAISGDMNTGVDPVSGDLPGGGNIGDEFGSGGDTQATTGATVSTSNSDYGQFGRAQQNATAGGGGGGGGKVVCTMMNNSYGFGSFRNKIWLKHSKDLPLEYQIGYHKIFLPLIKLSKNNKVLKKTLEHIAVHRTIDIRQEARGKMHLLGRVYRKILEPVCYLVGKYVK